LRNIITALALVIALQFAGASPAGAQSDQIDPHELQQAELQIGQQFYDGLLQKGEILPSSSPYYKVLAPIARQIKRIADSQYFRPFTFVLVHETQPNAFAVPGGNVYVTDSLMKLVENREELAGVLCHETSHDIHHDVVNNIIKDQRAARNTSIVAGIANLLTGGRLAGVISGTANIELTLRVQNYSREVETAADLTGADTCARAGSNPWGMVWLFKRFEKASTGGQLEILSDHPADEKRIAALEQHFVANPALFGRFPSSIASATPLSRS
jgi:beta-barrel assembly-enhancing protease